MSKKHTPPAQDYRSHILQNNIPYKHRLLIGIPMTGLVRAEWMLARFGQIIPTNWSQLDCIQWIDTFAPVGYMVADARNACVQEAVERGMEWLLFIDHDTVLPPDAFLRLNDYMREGKYPVVSGLYFTRSNPSEPLIYRGRGNSFATNWLPGDKVWVDGIPMGCTLIHCSILKAMYDESEEYRVGAKVFRRVFDTPNKMWFDPETGACHSLTGTEDLDWCDRVMKGKFLEKAGWAKHAKKHPKYPFMMDTGIFCRHIGMDGQQFPENWQQIQQAARTREQNGAIREIA